MSEFENVTVVKAANVYFDGGVISRTIRFTDGSEKTLGFMQPGDYEFNTADKENMKIMSGNLEVLLPNTSDWINVTGGESFDIAANSSFKLKVIRATDYCYSFIK